MCKNAKPQLGKQKAFDMIIAFWFCTFGRQPNTHGNVDGVDVVVVARKFRHQVRPVAVTWSTHQSAKPMYSMSVSFSSEREDLFLSYLVHKGSLARVAISICSHSCVTSAHVEQAHFRFESFKSIGYIRF